METNTINKPSQVMAWLGFGISLALFLLVWGINAVIFCHLGDSNSANSAYPYAVLYMMLIIIGSILGILGLVFSIIGLVSANKNGLKKLPGVLGISLCCASLLSVFAPILYTVLFIETEHVEVIVPPSNEDISSNEDVILSIERFGDVKCNKADGSSLANMSAISKCSFSRELKTWLQTNGYNENVSIVIKADTDVDYNYIANVIEALNDMGIKKFSIKSDYA